MKIIKRNLKWITLAVSITLIIGVFIIKYSLYNSKTSEIKFEELELELETQEETMNNEESLIENVDVKKNVYVDIKGAVQKPGVYEIAEDKKVIDVVNLAGGFTNKADTSMINLAKKVSDEMVIIIYTIEEVKNANKTETVVKVIEKECTCPEIKNDACINQTENNKNGEKDNNGKVNINTATLEELITLSGIGQSKAEAIIAYREEYGNFQKIEDIMHVSGIGESAYEKIKNSITV